MANNNQGAKSVNVYIDDAPARAAYDRLTVKADAYNKKIEATTKATERLEAAIKKSLDAGGAPVTAQKRLEALNKTLEDQKAGLAKVNQEQQKLQQQIDGKTGPSMKSQAALVTRLYNEYKLLGQNTEEAKKKLEEYGAASKTLDHMKARLDAVRKAQEEPPKQGGSNFMTSFMGNMSANLAASAGSMVLGFFKDSVEEALAADQATQRLHNTLENLGRLDAFERISAKADDFAAHFKYLDNDDIVGVYNKLIDYGKLTEGQMNQLMPVIIDFAAKQKISIEESSSVIIKALEGNGKGLKEYGIAINSSGTEADRLGQIMGTLGPKVKGAGDAFMESAEGGMKSANQRIANLKEEIGNKLIPVLHVLLKAVNYVFDEIGNQARIVKTIFSDVKAFITGGFSGLDKNKALRAAEKQANEDKQTVAKHLAQFEQKNQKELVDGINALNAQMQKKNQLIAGLQAKVRNGGGGQKDLQEAERSVKVMQQEIDGLLGMKKALDSKPLGIVDPSEKNNEAKKKSEEEARRRKQEQEEIKRDAEALMAFFRQKDKETEQLSQTELQKKLTSLEFEYAEKRKLAHGNQQLLLELDQRFEDQKATIWREHFAALKQEERDQQAKWDAEKLEAALKRQKEAAEKLAKAGADQLLRIQGQATENAQRTIQERKDALALRVLKREGFAKLEAQKEQMKLEEQMAIEAARKSGGSVELVEEEFRRRRMEMELQFYTQMISQVLTIAQNVADIASMDNQAKTAQENAALERQKRRNETEKAGHKKLLNGKLISQQEYNRRAKTLDDAYRKQEAAAKKKQWERQQRADVTAAVISGSQAILSALQTKPFFLGLIMAGLAAVKTKKQIDNIRSQPTPEFARGGFLSGPSHARGGMPVINPVTGRKEAEVEGGEVILSRRTVANNSEVVGALLKSSMHHGGARLTPQYLARQYQVLDYGGLARSMRNVRMFESGGVFPDGSGGAGAAQPQFVPVPAMSEAQEALLRDLNTRLAKGIRAHVVYQDIIDADSEITSIKEESTFSKGK